MMHIVICDDEEIFSKKIKLHVSNFLSENKLSAQISCYSSGNELISDITMQAALFLLDIKLPDISGLELASMIRHIQPDACIIFISSMADAVYASLASLPLRFIRKEFMDEELEEALSAFFQQYQILPDFIEVPYDAGVRALPISSINYVESDKHYINIYCSDHVYKIRGKLSDYSAVFSKENIISVSQSYMVNLRYVKIFSLTSVTLNNGFKINIGRKYKESFKSHFFKYQRKYYHAIFLRND